MWGRKIGGVGEREKSHFLKRTIAVFARLAGSSGANQTHSLSLLGEADVDFSLNRGTPCQVNWRVLVD